MRVLGLCDYYGELCVGGAEVVAREVYARLVADHGIEATLVGAVAVRPPLAAVVVSGGPRHVPVPGWDLTKVLGAQLVVSGRLARAARAELHASRPEVVHVNGLHFQSTAVGVRLARRNGLPLVATAHLADLGALPGIGGVVARGFDRRFAGWAARSADRVVAVSAAVAAHVVSLGVDPSRVIMARNGVDHQRFHARDRGSRTPWLRAALVGRLVANKGTMHALEAVAGARGAGCDVRLAVVGDGPLEQRARSRAAEPDLDGAVTFTGRVPDVERWLRASDVLLRPSYTEGLPLAVLESLACGTPVIATAVPGTAEAVQDARNGVLVPVGDAAALTDALIALHDDRASLESMSLAASAGADLSSWDISARAHLRAFTAALGPGAPHRALTGEQ